MEEWKQKKSEGAQLFKNGDWRGSLDSFQSSLTALRTQVGASNRHSRDIAVLLSNIVACKLKLGLCSDALREAQDCVEADKSWAKGHLRLAEVYAAMGRSNDAVNCCQRAVRLDPENANAKRIMRRELRKRDGDVGGGEGGGGGGGGGGEGSSEGASGANAPHTNNESNAPPQYDLHEDRNAPSFKDFLMETLGRFQDYYYSLDLDTRVWFAIALGLGLGVFFLAAFRGLSSLVGGGNSNVAEGGSTMRGDYGDTSAYERARRASSSESSYSSYDYYEAQKRERAARSSRSSSWSSGFEGFGLNKGFVIMAVSMGVGYFTGVSPFQIMMMFNMLTGGGGGVYIGGTGGGWGRGGGFRRRRGWF
ncbi:hypothetical protein TrCOL_g203 [Triparma columacea]|uniref:Uncharacterized protein n=1 Tax=Triparma columacea TaxID=722753 RepID=A0A9W7LBL1_9STRA|nr:hypothetical protein TrCOL_g203 [Triparma columacea]